MTVLRVAILADYAEEQWPSMDLVADMLVDRLREEHAASVEVTLVRPPMPRRLTRFRWIGRPRRAFGIDRIAARQWDYPAVARALDRSFDVFHVIDHTYAHLVHALPAERTMVTCHDVDAFRSVLQPDQERRSLPFRWMSRRILDGLCRAAHVACDSEATRDALVGLAAFPEEKLSVIPNGVDTGGLPDPDASADSDAALMLGARGDIELLHVGSTIPRKRIDVLLDVFARVRASHRDARLVRVGGPFTAQQRVHARARGVLGAVAVLPFVDRTTLAAVYRRAAVALLPSEREGFGLPVVEALACGTPVVASDIPVLRETGGDVVTFCPVGDVDAWSAAIDHLLRERANDPPAWEQRRQKGLLRASRFSWSRYASEVMAVYCRIAGGGCEDR